MKTKRIGMFACILLLLTGNAFAFESVTPSEAYDMVVSGEACILDVRTPQEWLWVGHPGENEQGDGADLEGAVKNVPVYVYHKKKYSKAGALVENRRFVKEVKKILETDRTIITMCRSGSRSFLAALALEENGFTNIYNMQTGFEGSSDSNGYRSVNGWKINGLPYNYSDAGMYLR